MSKIEVNNIVGDSFEDLTIAEMTMIQGSGDISPEITPTTPACYASIVWSAKTSSVQCAGAASAITGAISGAIVSAVKC